MDKIKKIFQDPLQATLAVSGLALLGFYAFYARTKLFDSKKKKEKNDL